jgi:hypothetical protein
MPLRPFAPRLGARAARAAAACAAATSLVAPLPAGAAPYFREPAGALPAPACGGSGCYTNSLVVADLDGDGDLDVLLANGGGYYVPGAAEPSTLYLNRGDGTFEDATAAAFGGASSRLRQVAVGDVDGDGDLDVYMPGGYGLDADKLLVQTAPGAFADQAATRLPAGLASRAGAAHFGDVDGDGDLDLVVTDWGDEPLESPSRVTLLRNDGAGTFAPAPEGALPPPLPVAEAAGPIDVDLHDVDNDFDLDLLVNNRNGRSRLFVNDGTGRFADRTADYPAKKGPYAYNTEACDVDGDGDLDLLVDNAGADYGDDDAYSSQLLINDGAGRFADQTEARVRGEPQTDDNALKCVDVDDDGHYDLVVASLANETEKLLHNDGTATFTYVPDAFPAGRDPTLGLDVGDFNGDAIADVFTGQGELTPRLERVYFGAGASARDTRPPAFRAVETPAAEPGRPVVVRLAVTDRHASETGQHVTDVSLSYESPAAAGVAKARFVGGDLFRAELPPQAAGATVTFVPKAVDRAGNAATGAPVSLTVGAGGVAGQAGAAGAGGAPDGAGAAGAGGVPDSAGAGGVAGQAGAGGVPDSAGAGGAGGPPNDAGTGGAPAAGRGGAPGTAGAPGAAGGLGSGGSVAAGTGGKGTNAAPDDNDDGCGCAVPGRAQAPTGTTPLLVALAALGLRRRRRGDRAGAP